MKLSELISELQVKELRGGDAEICSLCTDSRVAGEGDLFFCFRGTHADSHRYAAEAVGRGASAVVCEHDCGVDCPQVVVPDGREAMAQISAAFYGHPERGMKMVGVTGTNGKTTVAHMLFGIACAAGIKAGLIGTLGAKYGAKSVAPALTTPDPVFLFSLLADMRKEGVELVAMEVSAHALALGKVSPIVYDVAVFTNLTQDHLDFFGNMQTYGEAKKSLFSPAHCRRAVLNADDAFFSELSGCGCECFSYGMENPADAFAIIESQTLKGSRILINLDDELCETTIPMLGRHNVYNALAAASAARFLGIRPEAIARGLSQTERVDGRLEHVAEYRGADIFVDFAHTPDGLEKSLRTLKEHCSGRLFCLFGCGGNRDAGKRALMGEIAAANCDFSVLTSDNPRYEDPCAIIAQIEGGYRKHSVQYVAVQERDKATEYALNLLSRGDILLVAGKGGETYQEIMGIKYSYNDKDVIRSLIGKQSL